MILELPARLRPWEAQLSRLPRDLALSIGAHVARLALAIGPLPATRTGSAGEPDGYGGLGRRGSYERLLMGEWALAELWPEEFDRRAAAGEHVFLELARRSEAGARRSVLLLDAGPAQLGGPRIAHLAALVAFARRASAAGAELCWGVLQRLGGDLHRGLDEAGISALLEARSAYEASPALIEAWIERVQPATGDDLWLIGPPPTAAVAARARVACLTLEDVVEPGARRLRAEVNRPGRAPVSLDLPLPPPEDCARLLRDPYATAVAPVASSKVRVDVSRPVRFSADGRRVIVFDDRGGFLAWPIPSSPRATPGRMRRFQVPHGRTLRAAGTAGKKLLAITEGPGGDLLLHAGGAARRPLAPVADAPRFPADPLPGTCALVASSERRRRALMVGIADQLWGTPPLDHEAGSVPFGPVQQKDVVAWAVHADGATVVGHTPEGYILQYVEDRMRRTAGMVARSGPAAAFIGHDPRAYPTAAPIALQVDGARWLILESDGNSVSCQAPVGTRVIGVTRRDDEPRLLLLDRSERSILFDSPTRFLRLYQASAPIASACASSAAGHVAYLTREGELVVVALAGRAPVLRVRLEAVE